MGRLARGDRDALGPLMERHYRRLNRLVLSYLRDPDDALDAVQEVFVKAYQAASRWDGGPEVGPWLTRIAVNHSIDRYRRGRRRLPSEPPPEEAAEHERRPRTSLLAMGALSGHEADDAQAHVSRCPACADELARLRRLRELAALDPLRRAEPPLGVSALLARVNARLDAEPARRPRLTGRIGGWLPAGALAASLLAALLLRPVSPPAASSPAPSAAAQAVT